MVLPVQMKSLMIGLELGNPDRRSMDRMGSRMEGMSRNGEMGRGNMERPEGKMRNPMMGDQRFDFKEIWLKVIPAAES